MPDLEDQLIKTLQEHCFRRWLSAKEEGMTDKEALDEIISVLIKEQNAVWRTRLQ